MMSYYEFVLKKIFREHLTRKFGNPDNISSDEYDREKREFFSKDYSREYEFYMRTFLLHGWEWLSGKVNGPTVQDWQGRDIEIAKSKGGKVSVCDYKKNIIIPDNIAWPHPDIVKKLYQSSQIQAFPEEEIQRLSKVLGFYCDLQSLRSEDAITWSVLGTLQYFSAEQQCNYFNSMLRLLGIAGRVKKCKIQLWSRVIHPETLVSGGPELDALLIGDKAVILVESKWNSEVAKFQGKNRNKSQLELRREFLELYGTRIFPGVNEMFILLIDNRAEPDSYEPLCRHLTWEQLCEIDTHPLRSEVSAYYAWKKKVGS